MSKGRPNGWRPAGYVSILPYREALKRAILEGACRPALARDIFGDCVRPYRDDRSPVSSRMRDLMTGRQKSIPAKLATRIAEVLGRSDLLPDTCQHVGGTLTPVGVVRPKSDSPQTSREDQRPTTARVPSRVPGASVAELLQREQRAVDFLKLDNTIAPELVLAMVVWPPEHLET